MSHHLRISLRRHYQVYQMGHAIRHTPFLSLMERGAPFCRVPAAAGTEYTGPFDPAPGSFFFTGHAFSGKEKTPSCHRTGSDPLFTTCNMILMAPCHAYLLPVTQEIRQCLPGPDQLLQLFRKLFRLLLGSDLQTFRDSYRLPPARLAVILAECLLSSSLHLSINSKHSISANESSVKKFFAT